MRKARIYQSKIEIGQVLTLAYFGGEKPQVEELVEVVNNSDGKHYIGHVVSVGEVGFVGSQGNYKVKVTRAR